MRPSTVHAVLLATLVAITATAPVAAKDTDIYKPSVQPNVMVMFDNSSSMGFGVYEYTEDYGAYYDYLSNLTCGSGWLITDAIAGGTGTGNYFYGSRRNWTRTEVLTLVGDIGWAGTTTKGYTGDPADPQYLWYTNNMSHTGWAVNTDGTNTVSVDSNGHVLYNGALLPNGQDIAVHNWQQNYDGTQVDHGLAGLLAAPGTYWSGYFLNSSGHFTTNPAQAAISPYGRKLVVYFIPGNWLSMQCVYNLQVVNGCTNGGSWAWQTVPDQSAFTYNANYTLSSPNYPSNYTQNYTSPSTAPWTFTQPGATTITLHFKAFNTNNNDKVIIYTGSGTKVATYSGSQGAFWATAVSGSTVKVYFSSGNNTAGGWCIDMYQYQKNGTPYLMQTRMGITQTAIIDVMNTLAGDINWGLSQFNYDGGSPGNGAKIVSPLNPTFSDANRQNMITQLGNMSPGTQAGTPLCESAQDIFNYYSQHTNILKSCTKNYAIYVTDGFPSSDSGNSRIPGVTLTDADGDGYTQDPYQYATPVPPDYFDDAVHYGYTHSVVDGSVVATPATSTSMSPPTPSGWSWTTRCSPTRPWTAAARTTWPPTSSR